MYYDIIKKHKYGRLTGLTGIELNVTELCNRKCVFCPRHDPKIYPNQKRHVSREVINRLISELQKNEYEGVIYCSGFGEPLLCPEILDYILLLKEGLPKCYLEITTNGDFLTEQKIDVIRNHIDNIIIDCYDSEEQKNKQLKMLKKANFTKFKIRELWANPEEITPLFMDEVNFNNRAGAVQNIDLKINQYKQCFLPFYRITVDWNGDIIICCNDWFRLQKGLGNILTTPFYDLWFSETLTKVRQNLYNGNRVDSACKNCSAKGTIYGQESANLIINSPEKQPLIKSSASTQ